MSYTDRFKAVFITVGQRFLDPEHLEFAEEFLNVAKGKLISGADLSAIRYIAMAIARDSELDFKIAFNQALLHAQEQALGGKGQERHGGVDNGDWLLIAKVYGKAFLYGQAYKKMLEAPRLAPEARRRELLGAMVYIAFGIIYD
jgi:hypothetical protein